MTPSLLQPEDSQRVADALIAKIKEWDAEDIGWHLGSTLADFLRPSGWNRDWLPVLALHLVENTIPQAIYNGLKDRS